ncbi:MAG: oxygen-insensitive NAD(P)H nitroreductase [Gammaproteobacteria bacterium]|nr:oxygen-insensitive NAD(P)H nitroreductase [Gammaproteobacteria bacterium]MBU1625569.1 oxygen-insensitive NAD(P)H nitroreductase [Gammaproteobacteria bacterium]MBU1980829.1 oxygen-insensitive NAD(P)H nitroreductase [Gammaproteobacteria bacterium]
MDIARIVLNRHTCKAYDAARKIPAAQVEQLKTLLRYSPSSINSQPWHFIIASSEAGKARIAKAAQQGAYASNGPKIRDASHVVVFCARTAMDDAHLAGLLAQEDADGRYPTPESKAAQSKGRSFYTGLHRYEAKDTQQWMEKQVYLALGTLLLGAAALEIDATPIEGFDMRILNEELGLREQGLTSVVLATLGYRSVEDFNAKLPKSRFPMEQVISEL